MYRIDMPKPSDSEPEPEFSLNDDGLKLISVKVTPEQFEGLSELLRRDRYPNRSEAIRAAIRDLIRRDTGEF